MSLKINSNIASLNAQRNLGIASKNLSESFTRLSSGLRINKAVDDAAGLAIAESLKTDTRVLNQGVRNLNDGISTLTIADSALSELSNVIIRIKELAAQSANGTISNKQRDSLDKEAQALAKEYTRIARTTEFNGRKVFNSDYGDLSLAAGGSRNSLIQSHLGGAVGEGTFGARSVLVTGTQPISVQATDYDFDGDKDLMSVDYGSGTVSIFRANGNGTFAARQAYSATSTANDAVWTDVSGDGIADIAVVGSTSQDLVVLLGNADGSYKAGVSYAQGYNLSSIRAGDLDNDNNLDFVITNYANNAVSVVRGLGGGTFARPVSYQTGGTPNFAITQDFNRDGVLDIAVSEFGGGVAILLGNGDGTFRGRISVSLASAGPQEIFSGDANNDGIDDLVTADWTSHGISVLLGNGNGTFKKEIFSAGVGGQTTSVILQDADGDGISDVMATEFNNQVLLFYKGNGDGTFRACVSYSNGYQEYSLKSADLNGDGALDFFNANYGDDRISIYLANTNHGVSEVTPFSLKTQYEAKVAMASLTGTLDRIAQQRGQIGGFYSRVDVAVNALRLSSLNYGDAMSRISDTDIAEESAKAIANKILVTSGAAVLAQANQQPTLAIQLLKEIT